MGRVRTPIRQRVVFLRSRVEVGIDGLSLVNHDVGTSRHGTSLEMASGWIAKKGFSAWTSTISSSPDVKMVIFFLLRRPSGTLDCVTLKQNLIKF